MTPRSNPRRLTGLLSALALTAAALTTPYVTAHAADEDLAATAHAENNLEAHTPVTDPDEGIDRFIVALKDTPEAQLADVDPEAPLEDVLDEAAESNGIDADAVTATATGDVIVETGEKLTKAQAKEFMEDLAQGDNVDYIEPDVILTVQETPDDVRFSRQWGLHGPNGARVDKAWDHKVTGDKQTIAIVDTGILPHPDLDDKVLPGYDFISTPYSSRDGDGRDSDPTDEGDWFRAGECQKTRNADSTWHGTHVAGIAAAITNNFDGIAGVAPDANILPVRAVGKCGGNLSDIADALIWASGGRVPGAPVNPNPATVINMSLAGPGQCSRTYQKAINTAVSNGATVVVAAGNEHRNARGYQPASCNNVIVVGATGENGDQAGYSNYGNAIDLMAPGGDRNTGETIVSTLNTGRTTPMAASYGTLQGTSQATPVVSGVAALLKEADDTLTPSQIEDILTDTARELPGKCTGGCGAGLVDANAAVAKALGTSPDSPNTDADDNADDNADTDNGNGNDADNGVDDNDTDTDIDNGDNDYGDNDDNTVEPTPTPTPTPAPRPTPTPQPTPRPIYNPYQPYYPYYTYNRYYPTYPYRPVYPTYPRYTYYSPYRPTYGYTYYPSRSYTNAYTTRGYRTPGITYAFYR